MTEPPLSCEEIIEWRALAPLVKQMIPEWQKVRSQCTLASKILNGG